MGPDETVLKDGEMLCYSCDGISFEPIPKPPMDYAIPELDSSYFDEFYTVGFDLAKESDMTIYGYFMLSHKKMSRKTFKKWLMSKGFDRDLSEWFCRAVKSFKGQYSYQSLYLNGLLFASTLQNLFNVLFDTRFPIPNLTLNNKETEE